MLSAVWFAALDRVLELNSSSIFRLLVSDADGDEPVAVDDGI